MFRYTFKIPLRLLRKPPRYALGFSRHFRTSCIYNAKGKEDHRECPKDGSGRGFYYTVGAVVIGTAAVVAYAKHDQEFRSWLRDNVPGSDEFITFVTAEETSHIDYLTQMFSNFFERSLDGFYNLIGSKREKPTPLPPCDGDEQPFVPPRSAFQPLIEEKKEEKYDEKRVLEKKGNEITINTVESTRRGVDKAGTNASEVTSLALVELEEEINKTAQIAIKSYREAICVLRDHAEEIYKMVEQSVEKTDTKIWSQIKEKGLEREKLVKIAEKAAKEAESKIDMLKSKMNQSDFPGGESTKAQAQRNIERTMESVNEAKKMFISESSKAGVTDKYWVKVQEARRHFAEELEILFPNVRLSEKNLKLADGELDLFILYAFQNILYYQKELTKIDTISKMKFRHAIEKSAEGVDSKIIEAAVEAEMDVERRKIGLEFQKRMLSLKAECERDMRLQMKRQAEAHADHLVEAMAMKEKEMERKMRRKIDEEINREKTIYKAKMAAVIGRLKGLDDTIKKRAGDDQKAQKSQVLWSACQSLEANLRGGTPTAPWDEQLKPLKDEVGAIKKAAAPGDDFVQAVVDSIPEEALERGVFTEVALRDRFLRVERVASRVALLPNGGGSLPIMLLSYIQSMLIVRAANPIPTHELANEPFEPSKFNTYDILQRARYWVDRGDFSQTLRYMNLLTGASKAVSSEWMKEVRIFLETQMAAQALMAHASACGLVYS